MLEKFIKKLNGYYKRNDHITNDRTVDSSTAVSKNIKKNMKVIAPLIAKNNDIVTREFMAGERRAVLYYVDGLASRDTISDFIMRTLMDEQEGEKNFKSMDTVLDKVLVCGEVSKVNTIKEAIDGFLKADLALFIDGFSEALVINTKGFERRSIQDPQTDSVIRGPREAFVESMRSNTALLRRRIRSTNLVMESVSAGRNTKTDITLAYLEDTVKDGLVEEIKKRISKINIDGIIDSGYIEQFISDHPNSVFPTMGYTEKPDIAAAKILEGRVAIIVDGSPFVLTAPALFAESFQSPEDYYNNPVYASVLRIIRYLSFFISIFALPIYVAVVSYHYELIPMSMLLSIAAAEEGTPFSTPAEAFIMILVFEILKEAGVRMPKPVGQAVSIVGALVIGETAVSAGIIGAPMVIAVALTALTAFVVPMQTNSVVILRYIMLFLATLMGGVGIVAGGIGILLYLSGLNSFGTFYFEPIASFHLEDMKDIFIRAPLKTMLTRPVETTDKNPRRQIFYREDI